MSAVTVFALLAAARLEASPTMIRLGYADCAACHVSPQGAGLLTTYGKGVDTAQSLRRGEYEPTLNEQRRLLYDVRFVMAAHAQDSAAQPALVRSSTFRFMLRSALKTSERTRLSYVAGLESPMLTNAPSSTTSNRAANVVVSKATFEYRPTNGVEIAFGRDVLPDGLGLPDAQTFRRRQTDVLGTAYPTQVKAFLWNDHLQVTPYAFGPGGDEERSVRQHGGGILAGIDMFKHRAVVGVSGRASRAEAFDRNTAGVFARLGFGKWGVFAEHDVTSRMTRAEAVPTAQYVAGFTQVFFAPWEWFVTSVAAENIVVEGAGARRLYRLSPAAQVRVSENLTVIFNTRDELARLDGPTSRTYSVQVAVKTVQ
jgi:hypothetical protein